MNREIILILLRKNIRDLDLLTESLSEMTEFPPVLLRMIQQKVKEIQDYVDQLIAEEVAIVETEKESEIFEAQTNEKSTETLEKEEEIKNGVTNFQMEEENSVNETIISSEIVENISFEPQKEEIIEQDSDETAFEPQKENEIFQEETEEKISKEKILEAEMNELITSVSSSEAIDKEKTVISKPTLSQLFSQPENNVEATLSHQKIDDIKKAISIGDRFRFQRELFKGNGEDMNKTLNYLNQLATFEEAVSFLEAKYHWEKDNETAEDFYRILKRRF
jgi:hypothetical protein